MYSKCLEMQHFHANLNHLSSVLIQYLLAFYFYMQGPAYWSATDLCIDDKPPLISRTITIKVQKAIARLGAEVLPHRT